MPSTDMRSLRLLLVSLPMLMFHGLVHAIIVGPGQTVTASFSLASAPTTYGQMFSEIGFNQPGVEDFRYTIYDGNNVALFTQQVNLINASYTQFWIANPVATSSFSLVVDQIGSTFNIDGFNVQFFNYLPNIEYPDYANATSGASRAPNIPYGNNHFVVSSVPEPETYAMMMAGLGLLGFIAKRKKQA